jgi:hypothetical protein
MATVRHRVALLDADSESIAAAIELVEDGSAVSVTLVGLRYGARLLPLAVAWGQASGVTVTRRRGAGRDAIVVSRRAVPRA